MPTGATRSDLEKLLAEDVPYGDLTTDTLGISDQKGEMTFSARGPMVLAEAESATSLLEMVGCHVSPIAHSGELLAPGDPILTARGPANSLHRGWKVAQTLIEVWSGVATAARAIVDAATAVSPGIVVACTRKNVPGTKSFAVRAIRAGGATLHRLGLSETVLFFPEHRIFLHAEPLAEIAARLRRAAPEKKIIIEATTIENAKAAIEAGFDIIQTEKFSPDQVSELTAWMRSAPTAGRPLIVAAGGINAANAAAYALAGADVIATSAPYIAGPRDVQVRFTLPSNQGALPPTKTRSV